MFRRWPQEMFKRSVGSPGLYHSRPTYETVNPDLLLDLDFTTTSLPSEVDNYSRASVCAPITGVDGSGGVEVTKFASGAYAYAYHSAFSHSSKTGMLSEAAATNLITKSEQISPAGGWANLGCTATDNYATAPDGTTTANRLEFVATSNRRTEEILSASASTQYVASVFLRATSGTANVDLKIEGYDGTTVTTLQTVACALDENWARFEATGTLGGSDNQVIIEISNGTNGAQDVLAWGAQVETGSEATSYIPTSGASASRARTAVHIANAFTSGYIEHEKGQVDCVYVPTKEQNTDQYYWRFSNGSGSNDRKQLRSNGGGNWRVSNSAGSLVADVSNGAPDPKSADAEYTRSVWWDSTATPCASTTVDADEDTGGSAYTDGTEDGELYIASGQIADRELEGIIATLTVYSQEQT